MLYAIIVLSEAYILDIIMGWPLAFAPIRGE